jgi:UDP-N-acetylglucosamine/UDP-N-acetylgalactosamine diphosphorylase
MQQRLARIRSTLEAHDQSHLLAFYNELDGAQQRSLLDQIEALDFRELDPLIDQYVRRKPPAELPAALEPASFHALSSPEETGGEWRRIGEELIRAGRIAAFVVAGGQGTRLGWNGPKGTYPATPVTGKPLFRLFAEQILAGQRRYSVSIPWYVMTSPINDGPTRAFFQDNNYFGLEPRQVMMFPQGLLPSFEMGTGKLLLDEPGVLAMNPDGHGGSLKALRASGALADMRSRGIEHVSYFQVDNPLVNIIDPRFIGLHAAAPDSSAEMSSKMVTKANAAEKVGVFCRANGRTCVVEYSDLPRQFADQVDSSGRLRFIAGSIAIHLISVAFVERLTADAHHFALPYHRAEKKVPCVDPSTGRRIEPEKPNAVKLETFVFDALPLARSSIVCETRREDEFAPIKNADGVDSPATSHELQVDRAARWLVQAGVKVPRDGSGKVLAQIEISPLTALHSADLRSIELPRNIAPGAVIAL